MSEVESKMIPWPQLYDFILKCGSVHDSYQFCTEIMHNLKTICYFDQGLVWFLDGNGKKTKQYLMGYGEISPKLYEAYYYSTTDYDSRKIQNHREPEGSPFFVYTKWNEEPDSAFIHDYIRPMGLKCSLTFYLYDTNRLPRVCFTLDRLHKDDFSELELAILTLAHPQLNNLYKKFYTQENCLASKKQLREWTDYGLTKRELEVVNLLCQAVSPEHISKILYISKTTVHKHISSIYKKLGVANMQELLVRLLGDYEGNVVFDQPLG